jgi:hypothetical protein
MKQLTIFISLLIISIFGFVVSSANNDPLLITLSWIGSIGFFLLITLNLFTNLLDQ